MAIHEATLAGGAVCGSFLGGFVYEHISVAALYGLASSITLAGTLIQIAFSLKYSRVKTMATA